ncbi:TetR/AcrR family transcriptional regulator [Anaerosacchariphilus polymeriproducens]|uniref:TetR/AcrR family transcriptional regulator n=1 Tax=Anaerosacchariphilus polymeriproducens TaxID=1812858 RepID=A0A371AX54_9FIRM|nr:TetR/AcrR family transcriptional regulator [Anaerosacchariphilus polymeriproducens]RDU24165.1 TetR/AcrR family transcriptional regulator [Anaerosacchariphilus polymeriproducens]
MKLKYEKRFEKLTTTRKERRTEFNKSNIIAAAKKQFDKNGIAQTTVDDIAKEADYSKATLYAYFKSKEEIYHHIVFESMKELKNRIQNITVSTENFEHCFYSLCNTLADFHDENPLYFDSIVGKISVKESDFEEQPVLLEIYNIGEEINSELVSLLQRAEKDGILQSGMEPVTTVMSLWASLYGIILLASRKEGYMEEKLGITKETYMKAAYQMLYKSVIKE